MRIAIIAALPGELKYLVSTGWKWLPTSQPHAQKWATTFADTDCVAVCAGMGPQAAQRAFAEAESEGPLDLVLSVGWAGALVDTLLSGGTYLASAVIDERTGERFELANGERDFVLVSTTRVAQEAEKRRLAATYRGAMVDMESATVARLAQMRQIPVVCMKAISDDLGAQLPDFNRFIDTQGQMRMAAFVAYVLVRPRYWPALVGMGATSSQGAKTLASAILTFLSRPRDAQTVNASGDVGCE